MQGDPPPNNKVHVPRAVLVATGNFLASAAEKFCSSHRGQSTTLSARCRFKVIEFWGAVKATLIAFLMQTGENNLKTERAGLCIATLLCFEQLCSLTKLKIHIKLSVLCKEAHIIRSRRLRSALHRGKLSDTPNLASIVTKVNSFDRRLDVGNIQLSFWVTLGNTASAAETAVFAFPPSPSVFLPSIYSLRWGKA